MDIHGWYFFLLLFLVTDGSWFYGGGGVEVWSGVDGSLDDSLRWDVDVENKTGL